MKRYTVIGLVEPTGYTVSWGGRARDHWHAFAKASRWFLKTETTGDVTLVACVDAKGNTETQQRRTPADAGRGRGVT